VDGAGQVRLQLQVSFWSGGSLTVERRMYVRAITHVFSPQKYRGRLCYLPAAADEPARYSSSSGAGAVGGISSSTASIPPDSLPITDGSAKGTEHASESSSPSPSPAAVSQTSAPSAPASASSETGTLLGHPLLVAHDAAANPPPAGWHVVEGEFTLVPRAPWLRFVDKSPTDLWMDRRLPPM
jgi:hypothetical protein